MAKINHKPSSNTPISQYNYDVFLSFRGEDTRKSFTSHLHAALLREGIRTFRDEDELEYGKEISHNLSKAIQHSRIAVPIFSKNFVSSRWCLEEITHMIDYKKHILPVFFDVEFPLFIRSSTDAFSEHEMWFEKETVERWKEALKAAGGFKGWSLKDHAYGDEAKLVELVVESVLNELKHTPLHIAKHPIGIDSRVEDVMKLLDIGAEDVRMIGIQGKHGIGKTTISKAVYNQIFRFYDGSSFISSVREVSQQPNGLVSLQNQLVNETTKYGKPTIYNIDRGVNVIKERLRAKKVLVILDDIDDVSQLDVLEGGSEWFGLGSRIIITTRDEHLLKVHGVEKVYKPRELDFNQSLQLLSKNAYKRDKSPDEYMEISKSVVQATGGVPMLLEHIGMTLFGKTVEESKVELQKMREAFGTKEENVVCILGGANFSHRAAVESVIQCPGRSNKRKGTRNIQLLLQCPLKFMPTDLRLHELLHPQNVTEEIQAKPNRALPDSMRKKNHGLKSAKNRVRSLKNIWLNRSKLLINKKYISVGPPTVPVVCGERERTGQMVGKGVEISFSNLAKPVQVLGKGVEISFSITKEF
ncbi:disease resistance protein RPV1-like isoform X2 [Tasmannia lanceolata]|uniref:disease resistance protein RPV1-like isoform X2 n=1 Tax=Tasmannia lanceolata TaxID=3420 RepID=UPI004062933D